MYGGPITNPGPMTLRVWFDNSRKIMLSLDQEYDLQVLEFNFNSDVVEDIKEIVLR